MALRVVAKIVADTGNQCWAKVLHDSEWNEYRVKFYRHAEYIGQESDYHTEDKQDALLTAGRIVERGF